MTTTNAQLRKWLDEWATGHGINVRGYISEREIDLATFVCQKSADNARCILCKKEKPVICGYCKQAEMEAERIKKTICKKDHHGVTISTPEDKCPRCKLSHGVTFCLDCGKILSVYLTEKQQKEKSDERQRVAREIFEKLDLYQDEYHDMMLSCMTKNEYQKIKKKYGVE